MLPLPWGGEFSQHPQCVQGHSPEMAFLVLYSLGSANFSGVAEPSPSICVVHSSHLSVTSAAHTFNDFLMLLVLSALCFS